MLTSSFTAIPPVPGPLVRHRGGALPPHLRHPGNRESDYPGSESHRVRLGSPIPALRSASAGMTMDSPEGSRPC